MVSIRVLRATADLIEISPMQGRGEVTRSALETGLSGDTSEAGRQKAAVALAGLLQRDIEKWHHVDEPDMVDEETLGLNDNQMEDRFGERMRYERQGPDRWLVSTEAIITVAWNGVIYLPTLRRAR